MLNVKDLEEVQKIINNEIISKKGPKTESIPIEKSLNRILAEDIVAPINVPSFKKSMYDGYAVKAKDTYKASEANSVKLEKVGEIRAGQKTGKLNENECMEIATGAPLPEGANAVLMIENVEVSENQIIVRKSVHPSFNTVEKGEDIKKGQKILNKGKKLTYKDTGLISSLGIDEFKVFQKPSISVISTGDEVILPGEDLSNGKIYDINGRTITDALKQMGAKSKFLGIGKDKKEDLKEKIKRNTQNELIIISGGASVGEKDYTIKVLENLGQILIHGVAVKPGKPLIIAKIGKTPVIGLPGNPTSSLIQLHKIVKPIIEKMLGTSYPVKKEKGKLTEKVKCPKGRKFLLPVYLDDKKVIPTFKGSFALTSFTKAEGYIEIPKNIDYVEKNQEVQVNLFNLFK